MTAISEAVGATTPSSSASSYFLYTPLRFKQGVKTNSGVKKRIRLRGSGSLKRYVPVWNGYNRNLSSPAAYCAFYVNPTDLFLLALSVLFVTFPFRSKTFINQTMNALTHRMKSGRSHNTGFKDRQRVNRLGSSTQIEEKKIEKRIRKMMGCY